ncbi:hypothetical protein BCR42DRAFT_181394 [Absidia repens]|uniref:Uncharacterized protein n=1 Tax=Absidia repens TaxID=90262 RepID=A0A1X2HY65_9FUNG|nr:hypothetical protein BCR42DRAFT_181394 [Absidia repens]
MVPTVDNRRKGNDIVDNNEFNVTYTKEQGPQHPFAMGKSKNRLHWTLIKKIRLCVISYAGLSNNPGDVAIFLKYEKCFSYVYFILTFVLSFIGSVK